MSRKRNAHPLIEQAAEQATALVDQAAEQASALVDQMAPHVEAARDRVVTEYVPQARKAGRRARKQVLEEYVPQAKAALTRQPEPKRRGREFVRVLAVIGLGALVASRLRSRNISPAAMYEAPAPVPVPEEAAAHDPAPEDLQRLEDEAPLHEAEPPEDSLNAFFDEMVSETAKGSRRR
jgi:vacuolar-type H+-ATPase subunit H